MRSRVSRSTPTRHYENNNQFNMNEQDLELKLKPLKQELSLFQLNTLKKLGELEAQLKSHSHPIVVNEAMEKRVNVLEKEQVNLRDYANEELKAIWEQIKPSPHDVNKPKSLWKFWR